jgi:hypothetical protein
MWMDEANFSRDGMFNQHNEHFYSLENPHITYRRNDQRRFSVNVWAGILGTYLLGPVFLPKRVNGDFFFNFLEKNFVDLIDEIPLAVVHNSGFQMDGAPPHNVVAVSNWLDINYPNRWIGRNDTVLWSARSPDLTLLDFFLWSVVKSDFCQTPVNNREELLQRIQEAFQLVTRDMLQLVSENIVKRARPYVVAGGSNFQHLL